MSLEMQDRIRTFIESFDVDERDEIENLRDKALQDNIPIIRRDMQSFLKSMLTLINPDRVLEIGAGVGYSAIFMSEYIKDNAHIDTIESSAKRGALARENIALFNKNNQITLYEADAFEVIDNLKRGYDLIFMDAAKGQYKAFLPLIVPLLRSGGVLICDNVLFGGDIIESIYLVERRNRTIHKRMRAFLHEITHTDELTTSILPVGDGATFSVKK